MIAVVNSEMVKNLILHIKNCIVKTILVNSVIFLIESY